MPPIPWFSTFTLGTEILVTVIIFAVFYFAYSRNRFLFMPVAVVLAYEVGVNISYLVYRGLTDQNDLVTPDSPFQATVATIHGIFSPLMFICLVAFMVVAWPQYARGMNFFRAHKRLTAFFLASWLITLFSGFLFYYNAYLRPEVFAARLELPLTQ